MDVSATPLASMNTEQSLPLCVDMDGTLLRSDVLLESAAALVRQKPLRALLMPAWLVHGRANLKHAIAESVDLNVARLPYRTEVLEYLKAERRKGRQIVLVTASTQRFAEQVAEHLGCFDEVMASTDSRNLKGRHKARALAERFGDGGFVYIGDSMADVPVWRQAAGGLIVGGNGRARRAARELGTVTPLPGAEQPALANMLRAMRPHQWLKNLLVFVPLLAAHQTDPASLLAGIVAFAAFSLVASGTYLINDVLDLEADRDHPSKRERPFAAGDLSLVTAAWLIPTLLACGFVLSLLLPTAFVAELLLYAAVTIAYSVHLKRWVVVDVMTLAALYTLRVLAGGAAVMVDISFWLIAFSMFLFLSLALVKRTAEMQLSRLTQHDLSRRGYTVADIDHLRGMGIASGYVAVLVVALYINSDAVTALYSEPQVLWLLCPVMLYWTSRMWLKTGRGEMHDDPLVFTVKDRTSQLLAVVSLAILFGAL